MEFPYDDPGVYAIHIAVRVETSLGGMTVRYEEGQNGEPASVLKGTLPDQAALLGILTTLYNARLPLLLVRYLRPE
jgi:hypothetical protein